jgi:hypothetical protein
MSQTTTRTRVNVLERIAEQVRMMVPEQLRDFDLAAHYGLVQLHFPDNPLGRKIHFELWQRHRFVELGLHFESDVATNDWLYSCFAQRQAAIDAALNTDGRTPPVLTERWDKGWTRVHCEYPISGSYPDTSEAPQIAARMAAIVATLHPMFVEIVEE